MSTSRNRTFVRPSHHGDTPSMDTSLIDPALREDDDDFRDLFEDDEETAQNNPQQYETTPNLEGGLVSKPQHPEFTGDLAQYPATPRRTSNMVEDFDEAETQHQSFANERNTDFGGITFENDLDPGFQLFEEYLDNARVEKILNTLGDETVDYQDFDTQSWFLPAENGRNYPVDSSRPMSPSSASQYPNGQFGIEAWDSWQQAMSPEFNDVNLQLPVDQQLGSEGYWRRHEGPIMAPLPQQGFVPDQNGTYQTYAGGSQTFDEAHNLHQQIPVDYEHGFHQSWNRQEGPVLAPHPQNATRGFDPKPNGSYQEHVGGSQTLNGTRSFLPTTEPSSSPARIRSQVRLIRPNYTIPPFEEGPPPKSKPAKETWLAYTDQPPRYMTSPFPEYMGQESEDPNDFLDAEYDHSKVSPFFLALCKARTKNRRDFLKEDLWPRIDKKTLPNHDSPKEAHLSAKVKEDKNRNALNTSEGRFRKDHFILKGDFKSKRRDKGAAEQSTPKVLSKIFDNLSAAQLMHRTIGRIDWDHGEVACTFHSHGCRGTWRYPLDPPQELPQDIADAMEFAGYEPPRLRDYLLANPEVWQRYWPEFWSRDELPPHGKYEQQDWKHTRGGKRGRNDDNSDQNVAVDPNHTRTLVLPPQIQHTEAGRENGAKKARVGPASFTMGEDVTMVDSTGRGSLQQRLAYGRLNNWAPKSKASTHAGYRQRQFEAPRNEQFKQDVIQHMYQEVEKAASDQQARQAQDQMNALKNQAGHDVVQPHAPMPAPAPARTRTPTPSQPQQNNSPVGKTRKSFQTMSSPEQMFDIQQLHGEGRRPVGTFNPAWAMSHTPAEILSFSSGHSFRGKTGTANSNDTAQGIVNLTGKSEHHSMPPSARNGGPNDSGFFDEGSLQKTAPNLSESQGDKSQPDYAQYYNENGTLGTSASCYGRSTQGDAQDSQLLMEGDNLDWNDHSHSNRFGNMLQPSASETQTASQAVRDGDLFALNGEGFGPSEQHLKIRPTEQSQTQAVSIQNPISHIQTHEPELQGADQGTPWPAEYDPRLDVKAFARQPTDTQFYGRNEDAQDAQRSRADEDGEENMFPQLQAMIARNMATAAFGQDGEQNQNQFEPQTDDNAEQEVLWGELQAHAYQHFEDESEDKRDDEGGEFSFVIQSDTIQEE